MDNADEEHQNIVCLCDNENSGAGVSAQTCSVLMDETVLGLSLIHI